MSEAPPSVRLGQLPTWRQSGRHVSHSPALRVLRNSICPQDKPAMKTRTQRILHCTVVSRAGRLLAAALSLAIWTNATAANQATNVPAPLPNKLERITEFFNNEVATGKLPGAVVLIQQHGKP